VTTKPVIQNGLVKQVKKLFFLSTPGYGVAFCRSLSLANGLHVHVVTFSSGWLGGIAMLILEDPSGGWCMLLCIHLPYSSMPFLSGLP
jgi:hypothetical protein